LSDKLTTLFEPHHARQYGAISFEIRRSMGGSAVSSPKKLTQNLKFFKLRTRRLAVSFESVNSFLAR